MEKRETETDIDRQRHTQTDRETDRDSATYSAGFSCQILFVILFVITVIFLEITADITDFLFLQCFIVPCEKFVWLCPRKTQQPQEQRYPFL